VDLAVQGLVCLPQEIRKYTGYILKMSEERWCNGVCSYNTMQKFLLLKELQRLYTEAKADKYICDTNVREGLPIKNRFIMFEDRVEVELTGGKTLIGQPLHC